MKLLYESYFGVGSTYPSSGMTYDEFYQEILEISHLWQLQTAFALARRPAHDPNDPPPFRSMHRRYAASTRLRLAGMAMEQSGTRPPR